MKNSKSNNNDIPEIELDPRDLVPAWQNFLKEKRRESKQNKVKSQWTKHSPATPDEIPEF